MKVALVYDWIDKWGGAERILTTLFAHYPQADIFTLYANYKGAVWAQEYRSRVHGTFVNTLYRYCPVKSLLAPFMPSGIESLDLSNYDVILSISSSFAKGVLTRPDSRHLCYLFCPTRFLWHEHAAYSQSGIIGAPFFSALREWDYIAAQRPDRILTLSDFDQRLIKKYYDRDATVLYPPFDYRYWQALSARPPLRLQPKSFFLFVGRAEPYKRIGLLLSAFKDLKDKLVIVSEGTGINRIKSQKSDNVTLLSNLADEELAWLYQNAQALIMPQSEDFGYSALESLLFKTPVISYARSGVAEFVKDGQNGLFFETQTTAAIQAAVAKFHTNAYNFSQPDWQQFSPSRFLEKLDQYIS